MVSRTALEALSERANSIWAQIEEAKREKTVTGHFKLKRRRRRVV